jgi:phosphoribosylamine---glycine ligase
MDATLMYEMHAWADNVRFGDPECQVLCKRLKTDMVELLYRAATDRLGEDGFAPEWYPFSSVVVVLAASGYPGAYRKGSVIRGLAAANALEGVTVYHAGTARGGGVDGARDSISGAATAGTSGTAADSSGRAHHGAADDRNEEQCVVVSAGGRVLGVTANGRSILEAQTRAYRGVDAIDWPEGFCRRDIGWRAIAREQEDVTATVFP